MNRTTRTALKLTEFKKILLNKVFTFYFNKIYYRHFWEKKINKKKKKIQFPFS